MNTTKIAYLLVAASAFLLTFASLYTRLDKAGRSGEARETGEAEAAFNWWYAQRALPSEQIPPRAYAKAFEQYQRVFKDPASKYHVREVNSTPQWESLGPNNVGGRVLSLAIDPDNNSIIWAGAASGGLWRSEVKGLGAAAWTYINTGFPSLSVSAIAIDPANHNLMLIGTGELSFYQRALIGIRGARASYGMGILRSTDGGTSWDTTSIQWPFSQLTAVNRITFNPLNPQTVFAATSEGTFKSLDGGIHWAVSLTELLGIDIAINPTDTTIIYVSCGNYNSTPNPGIYKSTDAGSTWTKLSGGLPTSNFGRTALAIAASSPSTIYAGIANASSGGMIGLYKSTDNGGSWTLVSSTNYVRDQGWYNNVVGVDPSNANIVYCAGIDIYKSTNGGGNLAALTSWGAGYSVVPIGGPEGPSNYSHADHHAIAFDVNHPGTVYLGNDGGVFGTTNGGTTWTGKNGGFVTSQFYPGFAISMQDSDLALGGLQDNGTLRYNGNKQWDKVWYGDGGWCAINPTNDLTMYAEYTYLTIARSTNGGTGFSSLSIGNEGNFIAPFTIAPSDGNRLYAGGSRVYKSTDGGSTWGDAGATMYNGTNVSAISVSWTNADSVMAATGSGGVGESPTFAVYSTTNGGTNWVNVTSGLPSRYPTDIAFDQNDSRKAYVTYSGFGQPHVWRTTNFGLNWTNITANLPDMPVQSVVVDPDEPTLYVGTDLGVYRSTDAGTSWQDYNNGMPLAMIHDLVISPANRTLRAATHGHGVYQMHLQTHPTLALLAPLGSEVLVAGDPDTIRWASKFIGTLLIEFSADSGSTWSTVNAGVPGAAGSYRWIVPNSITTNGRIRISDQASDTVVVTSPGVFSIQAAPDMEKGWNILSVNVDTPEKLKTNLFPTAISTAYSFGATYVQRDSLFPGAGFWLKFSGRENFSFSGTPVIADTTTLIEGWNLIGAIGTPVAVSNVVQDPPDIVVSGYYGYKGSYVQTDSLFPKHGYWVKASGPGTLVMSSTPSSGARTIQNLSADTPHQAAGTITITTSSGLIQALTLVKDPLSAPEMTRHELPPPPPGNAFDVRFASQGLIASASADRLAISAQGPDEYATITWNIDATTEPYVLKRGEKVIAEISGTGSAYISLPTGNLSLVRRTTAQTPQHFSLEQNYPNPFNPSTRIRFTLPMAGMTVLEVFATNGAKVSTPVSGILEAGSHTVSFDASALSSGVYYYRLTSGTYSITKKMLLVR